VESVALVLEFALRNWRWGLEIIILSVTFYCVYRVLHGTRGADILVGLSIVLGFLALGVFLLNLEVLRHLLVGILTILPIGAIILFQQEIRQALAELALGRNFQSNTNQQRIINAVVSACESLAEKRHGALIALGGTLSPQDVLQSGVPIDAVVSQELLETIFYPKTALHDGAVWIRNGRIVAAACIFPITRKESLHRSHGLRHRAALGISEETDAVVIVVSEENGSLAVCHKGVLERPISPDRLRQRLSDLFSDRKKRSSNHVMQDQEHRGISSFKVERKAETSSWWIRLTSKILKR